MLLVIAGGLLSTWWTEHRSGTLSRRLDDQHSELRQTVETVQGHGGRIERTELAIDAEQQLNGRQQEELEALRARCTRLESQLTGMEQQLADLHQQLGAARDRLEDAEALAPRLEALEESARQTRAERDQLRDRIDLLEGEHHATEARLQRIEEALGLGPETLPVE